MEDAVRTLTRRRFLRGAGATLGLAAAPAVLRGFRGDVLASGSLFSLGVASGDPSDTSVVLWTRLAPEPLDGGGLTEPVPVRWAVFEDPGLARVVREGETLAQPEAGHAVHALVAGLAPDRKYFYRFFALGETSRVGCTRTFPTPTLLGPRQATREARFAVVSCQNYELGYYPAYRDIAEQDLDFVVHTGDFIYEGGRTGSPVFSERRHNSGEIFSVAEYRNRYALYRLDEDLQAAQASCPFIVTWDDHETDNNYAGAAAEERSSVQGAAFLERRRNAYRVYAESMPLRPANRQLSPEGNLRLFRRLRFGDLANLHVLDTRQFRTDQPAGDLVGSTDPLSRLFERNGLDDELFDARGIRSRRATLLGREQELWLARNLLTSRARWNVLAQQVMVMRWNLVGALHAAVQELSLRPPLESSLLRVVDRLDDLLQVDAWDGYEAARRRLFAILRITRAENPVVLSGDVHAAWAANLLEDFEDPGSRMVAAELVCTSISSTFLERDPRLSHHLVRAGLARNHPYVELFNGLFRGYCLCQVDADRWTTTYRAAGTLSDLDNPDELALVPRKDSPVEDDAVVSLRSGFHDPENESRLVTEFARLPLQTRAPAP